MSLKFGLFCILLVAAVNGQNDLSSLLGNLYGPGGGPMNGGQQQQTGVQNNQVPVQIITSNQQSLPSQQTQQPGASSPYRWGAWGSYGPCSVTCGQGQRRRQRTCFFFGTQSGSSSSGALGGILPLALLGGGLSGGASSSGLNDLLPIMLLGGGGGLMGGGTNGQSNGGLPQQTCFGSSIETSSCVVQLTCPGSTNCYSEWGKYGQCSTSCGEGSRIRARKCTCTNQLSGRSLCTEPLTEVAPCPNLLPCVASTTIASTTTSATTTPATVKWSNWGEWSGCSAECGVSTTEVRFRACVGSSICVGAYTDERECPVTPCPTEAPTWGDWGEYGPCFTSCGPGEKSRIRTCPVLGACPGSFFETVECGNAPCATEAPAPVWGEWTEYSVCSTTCGPGEKSRLRTCSVPGQCIGDFLQTADCENQPCATAPPPPVWGEWGSYGICSTTCGPGEKLRYRVCPVLGECPGLFYESMDCGNTPCVTAPPTPQWGEWGAYSECSTSCGLGSKVRFRFCPGSGCEGNDFENTMCNQDQPCATATWGDWGEFSVCTKTCGSGSMTRMRTCTVFGQCEGKASEVMACAENACPTPPPATTQQTLGTWSEFRAWGPCERNFEGGGCSQMRSRTCLGAVSCQGDYVEFRICTSGACATTTPAPTSNPNQRACDLSKPELRRDCGYPGISREECWDRGCCYSDRVFDVNWCYMDDFSAVGPRNMKEEQTIGNGESTNNSESEPKQPQETVGMVEEGS